MGSLSPNIGLQIPTVGGDVGPTFAQEINGSLSTLDSVLGAANVLNVAGNANVTLTTPQAQNMIQQFTGALTGNITVFVPATGRFYAIENATTGPFSLSVGCTGGGNTQPIPQGLSTWIWTDGTFARLSNPPGWQEVATYAASGAANVVVALPAPFRRFRLTLQSVSVNTASAFLVLRTSTDGGSNFTATGYSNAGASFVSSATASSGGSQLVSSLGLTTQLVANSIVDGTYEIFPGSVGGGTCRMRGNSCQNQSSLGFMILITSGASPDIGVNAINILPSAGTLSGTIIVEGLP